MRGQPIRYLAAVVLFIFFAKQAVSEQEWLLR